MTSKKRRSWFGRYGFDSGSQLEVDSVTALAFLGKQLAAIVISSVYAFAFTWGMLWLINKITPVKTTEADETRGLDEALHGEKAYEAGI